MLDTTLRNLRFAARTLARSPLFAIVAVLSIALGVGATTAIVTLADTLLLRPAPGIGDPGRVVTVGRTQDGRGFDNMSYPNFGRLSRREVARGTCGDPDRTGSRQSRRPRRRRAGAGNDCQRQLLRGPPGTPGPGTLLPPGRGSRSRRRSRRRPEPQALARPLRFRSQESSARASPSTARHSRW